MALLLTASRSRGRGGDDGGRVGAGAAGARGVGGGARVPHARQPRLPRLPRLPARLPHAAQRAVGAALPRAHPAPARTARAAGAALPVLGSHDGVARRVPGTSPHIFRVPAVVGAPPARAEPGGVVPGVLPAADPAPQHRGEPVRAAAHVHRVAVEPRRADLASHV